MIKKIKTEMGEGVDEFKEYNELSSLQQRLQKQIVSEIGKVGSGIEKVSMGYYKTNQMAHGFLETILDIPKQR